MRPAPNEVHLWKMPHDVSFSRPEYPHHACKFSKIIRKILSSFRAEKCIYKVAIVIKGDIDARR